jgi:catechol 2,3-dioxygenase-like lactoylglutathione lyase family enzyme
VPGREPFGLPYPVHEQLFSRFGHEHSVYAGPEGVLLGTLEKFTREKGESELKATSLNHVSVSAQDLQVSTRFYVDLFGLEPIPTPNFGFPVQWLRIGDLQLHLFQRPGSAPTYHHLAFTVDDIDSVYARAKEMGILDGETFGHHLYELPGNNVQLYVRDPGGNLLELDWPDASHVGEEVRRDIKPLPHPQSEDNLQATLFLYAAQPTP